MESCFSKNIKHIRMNKGMTQLEFAKKIGKDYSTIGKWELGLRTPPMKDIVKIAEVFDVPLDELLYKDLILQKEEISAKQFQEEVLNLLEKTDIDPKKKDTMINILEMVCEGGDKE